MTKQMELVLDLDGCAYDFNVAFNIVAISHGLIQDYHVHIHPDKWKFYEDMGLDGAIFGEFLYDYADEIFDLVPPHPDVIEHWQAMAERREVFVHVITARPPTAHTVTRDWLERSDLPFDKLSVVGPGVSKASHLTMDYPHYLILDDSAANLRDYVTHPDVTADDLIVMDQPWNREPDLAMLKRVHTWRQVKHEVTRKLRRFHVV